MASGQQKKRLKASSAVTGNLQQYSAKKKKNAELSQALSDMRRFCQREQVGIGWSNLGPFIDSFSKCGLADVVTIPEEILELEDMSDVLSYEVWETHLSDSERNSLSKFLPQGIDVDLLVQGLLSGENLHFGNPFLSCCKNPEVDFLQMITRKGSMKDRHQRSPAVAERYKVGSVSRKEEIPQKLCIRSGDASKYKSYIKISKKQHELVKNIKQSGDGIHSKLLNRVLPLKHLRLKSARSCINTGDEESSPNSVYHSQPLVRVPSVNGQCEINHMNTESKNSNQDILEHKDALPTLPAVFRSMTKYLIVSTKDSVTSSKVDAPLQRIPSLNTHQELEHMDVEEIKEDIMQPFTAPNLTAVIGDMNSTQNAIKQGDSFTPKDVWLATGILDPYHDHHTSGSRGYNSGELTLGQPNTSKQHPAGLIDLERDPFESNVGESLFQRRPSNDIRSAPLSSISNGGLSGKNWLPNEHGVHGVWPGVDISGSSGQCLGNRRDTDDSLYSIFSQHNKLQSLSYEPVTTSTEQYLPMRDFVGRSTNGNGDFIQHTGHQLLHLCGNEASSTAIATPTLNVNANTNTSWVNLSHQSSHIQDPTQKPFLSSWN
ncbi:hypothetical protein MKW94_027664 [Papaver nudicaule]|uniref:Uncharacterized protein n=1 Tax=Papaver nudicaule TaxID=74823 RepID=A0AA41W313_PAPNU|nr:hypothetical protein [Papaver nudicaule]